MKAYREAFEQLSRHFPRDWQEKAAEEGIRFQTRVGAKLEDIGQLLQIFFHQVANDLSLDSAVAWAAAAEMPKISGVALHKRIKRLSPYLRWMLGEMVGTAGDFEPERWGGYELLVVDGTTVVRPGDDRVTARVLYTMRLSDLRVTEIHVSDDKQGETFKRLEAVRPDQLFIADRAYSNPPGIIDLCAKGADVLVRFNWASLPLFDRKGRQFDVFRHLGKVAPNKPRAWNVEIRSGPEAVQGRLIVERLPREAARKARKRLLKENPAASKNTLRATGYRMLFTTAPPDRLSTISALALYQLRWQMELHIKRDKTIFNLKGVPNFILETIESWLYAKLILAHLARRMADEAIENLPPCREAQQFAA